MGANVLTALLGMTVRELSHNIRVYREALVSSGYDPDLGVVTLMLTRL